MNNTCVKNKIKYKDLELFNSWHQQKLYSIMFCFIH